ncbi:MAG TPA: hypothetical protein VNW51_04485 [Mucilaginibacter sp.]|jgi:hypothetical protein|nr:hypothetical protein [Mucilaginibacter sp.]
MAYSIITGEINYNVLYVVGGTQSVVYNSITYTTGQQFRGVPNVRTFTYSGTGTQAVYEILELWEGSLEYVGSGVDQPSYPDVITISGFAVEYSLNDAEKIVQETTKIQGFAIELIDYPFYSFEIFETRL